MRCQMRTRDHPDPPLRSGDCLPGQQPLVQAIWSVHTRVDVAEKLEQVGHEPLRESCGRLQVFDGPGNCCPVTVYVISARRTHSLISHTQLLLQRFQSVSHVDAG